MHQLYADHLFDTSNCASHSKRYAFGDGEELSDEHKMFCVECACVSLFDQNMRIALETCHDDLLPGEETAAELLLYYEQQVLLSKKYTAHICRKTHEKLLEQTVLALRILGTGVLIRADYKMKMQSLIWRESMPQFFGKKGFSWAGVSCVRYKSVQEKEENPVGDCVVSYYDILSDDAQEDSRAILR